MVAFPRALAVSALVFLLAGCASKPSSSATGARDADISPPSVWMAHPEVALNGSVAPVLASFAYNGPLETTTTYSGTFAPQEYCPFGACLVDQQIAVLDVTDQVPAGLRLQVGVTLVTPVVATPPIILPIGPDGDRLLDAGSKGSAQGATDEFFLHRTADGPIQLWLLRNEQGTGTYTLTLKVDVLTAVFDAYTPLGVTVPTGTTALVIETATPGGSVRLWDGKDTYLGSHALPTGLLLLPVPAGEAVLQFTDVTATTRIYALAPNGSASPALRVLGFARTLGQSQVVNGASPASLTISATGVPFGVGVQMSSDGQVGAMTEVGGVLKLTSPDGTALGMDQEPFCICGKRVELGAWGAPAVAGTYTADFTSTAAASVQLTGFTEMYQR